MAVRKLPAAAITEKTEVVEPTTGRTIVIYKVYNATPRPGRITWSNEDGEEFEVGGNEPVEIVAFP